MKNKMRKLVVFCALFIGVMTVSAQLSQHGLVLNGGLGRVDEKSDKWGERWDDIDYKVGMSLGYRFRFNKPEPKSLHYDLDINFGVKGARVVHWNRLEWILEDESGSSPLIGYMGSSGGAGYHYTSIGFTANYSLIRNFSFGLGVEPLYFFKAHYREIKNSFDVPVVARIAYNFKFAEIAISGKYGLVNVFETDYMKSGRIRELQLSLFIPFKTK